MERPWREVEAGDLDEVQEIFERVSRTTPCAGWGASWRCGCGR